MISAFDCEFIWPDHSSVFEESCMEELAFSTSTDRHRLHSAANRVLLVLVPGLRISRNNRMLVDYCGFMKGGEEELVNPFLVSKAVVMTTR